MGVGIGMNTYLVGKEVCCMGIKYGYAWVFVLRYVEDVLDHMWWARVHLGIWIIWVYLGQNQANQKMKLLIVS